MTLAEEKERESASLCFDFLIDLIPTTYECVSSPTLHRLMSQLFVEIWRQGGRGQRRLLHLAQSDVGSAVSAQNHLHGEQQEHHITEPLHFQLLMYVYILFWPFGPYLSGTAHL